jgi:uncharacterized phage-associated protein
MLYNEAEKRAAVALIRDVPIRTFRRRDASNSLEGKMLFRFDSRKAIEASATLLRLVPRREMDRKRLLALLYLADRFSLEKTLRPIIGGKLVAMKYGPIHSEVYDLIKGGHADQTEWSRHFHNESYRVQLVHDLKISALSQYDLGLLNEISEKHYGMDTWDVADLTHEFKEYKATYRENTSTPISLEAVIDAIGKATIKNTILRDAEEKDYFDRLFKRKK